MQDLNPPDNSKQTQLDNWVLKRSFPAWTPWLAILVLSSVVGILLRRAGFTLFKFSARDWPMGASILVWALFSLYWEAAARNAAAAAESEPRGSRRVHLFILTAAQLLIFLPVYGLRQRYLPASLMVATAGLTLQLTSLLLAVRARQCLGRNWSGKIAINVDHVLVRNGPYRWLRHPIYTALLGMYAGTAIVWGNWHALIGLGLAVFAYLRKIRLEETNLHKAFGPGYEDYRRQTWALVPGLF